MVQIRCQIIVLEVSYLQRCAQIKDIKSRVQVPVSQGDHLDLTKVSAVSIVQDKFFSYPARVRVGPLNLAL
jgi:hypothetical protein